MAINNYNKGTVQEQIDRVQYLMGINKPQTNENKKAAPLGIIERSEIGADGNCYAVIKENSKYYIKKSSNTKDLKLDDFEYLGGSHRYKNLYEYNSYNQAEKILKEEISSVANDIKKKSVLVEQAEKIDMNLPQTVKTKEMREEIDRQREIMVNASSILNEKTNIKPLNELSIDDDEQVLTDGEDDEAIALDDEIGDGENDESEDMPLDDGDLDAQDVELDQELVDTIPDLIQKIDDLGQKLDQIINSDEEFEGEAGEEGFDGEEEFDIELDDDGDVYEDISIDGLGESTIKECGDINTIAATVTNKQFDYDNANEDPKGRNNLPGYNKDSKNGINGDIGPQNLHKDTLDNVGDALNGSSKKSSSGGNEEIVDIVDENFGFGEKELYIVEKNGAVKGIIKESEFVSMLNGGKPMTKKNPAKSLQTSKPFNDKVKQLTDNVFKECVASGIIKLK
jgi:hypothetical protein